MNAMMLLPTKYDSVALLQKRRYELLRDAATEGFVFVRGSQELGTLLMALNKAIAQRQEKPEYRRVAEKMYSEEGKTERERSKENYKSAEEKRKAKSEASRRIRMEMQGGGKRK